MNYGHGWIGLVLSLVLWLPASSQAQTATPASRLAWDQVALTLGDAIGYVHEATADGGALVVLTGVVCGGGESVRVLGGFPGDVPERRAHGAGPHGGHRRLDQIGVAAIGGVQLHFPRPAERADEPPDHGQPMAVRFNADADFLYGVYNLGGAGHVNFALGGYFYLEEHNDSAGILALSHSSNGRYLGHRVRQRVSTPNVAQVISSA